MKKRIAVIVLVLASASFFAMAQATNALVVTVPFPFYVSGKLLPAGSYKIHASATLNEITVANDNGKDNALAAVLTRISTTTEDNTSVVFDVAGSDHYLSEIYIQGEDGFLIKGYAEKHTHMRVKGKR